jgi:hypothetical protein
MSDNEHILCALYVMTNTTGKTARKVDMAKRSGRKSAAEAKVERMTWFLMVLVFAVLYMLEPDQEAEIPNWFVPMSGAVILLSSGFYQFRHRWHVSPITWMAGTFLLMLALVNFRVDETLDFFGITLLIFAAVIGFGVLTGET